MTNNKILSICTPVYNKWNFTSSYLKDLSRLPNDHEIIIVDNASSDETQKKLSGSKEIIYYRNEYNKGFGCASNIAYSLSTASNILFMNNDIRVKSNHTDWTANLIKYCQYGLVGPTMGQLDKELNFVQEANKVLMGNSYMSGWCLAASKDIWEKLAIPRDQLLLHDCIQPPQIFCEDFFCYFEDTDLSFRARKQDIKMQVVDVPVVHFGKQTTKQLNIHELYTKSRQTFIKKWKK